MLIAAAFVACRRAPSASGPTQPADAAAAVTPGALLAGADTYGVVAGVLAFSDPGVPGFAPELRKDRELYQVLERRGVPKGNLVLLLDAAASSRAVTAELARVAARAPAGATLFFYYAGHGARDAAGRPYFLAHDTSGERDALFVDDVARVIGEKFQGKRVVLMADCCYSGALQQAAEKLRRFDALVLTSADASNLSTESWTFTQTVIDGLSGDALADGDGDGRVTLGELADEVAQAMKHREAQRHGYFVRGVSASEALARSAPRPRGQPGAPFAPGAYVRVTAGEARGVARVREAGATDSLVQFYRYNQAESLRVKNDALAPSTFRRVATGSDVSVFWGGKIWDARVQKTDGDFHFITYPGWPSYWDEWILSDRIAGERAPSKGSGEKVEVEWRGRWYPALVLERAGDRTLVHYVGYESRWDEWVTAERIRR